MHNISLWTISLSLILLLIRFMLAHHEQLGFGCVGRFDVVGLLAMIHLEKQKKYKTNDYSNNVTDDNDGR